MRDIISDYIIKLANEGKLDINNSDTEFDKLMKLYEINEIPTDSLINLLDKENYELTSNNLTTLKAIIKSKNFMSDDEINRIIDELKSIWHI